MIWKQFLRVEPILFCLVILACLYPVFKLEYFPTLDGPAHQYNVQLIRHLLQGDSSVIKEYFVFNKEPVPNWFGHLILLFFNSFLPAVFAEKALLVCYIAGLPLAFRYLLGSSKVIQSYLVFPFIYSCFFTMGFYNFCFALIFLFLTYGYWVKNNRKATLANYLIVFLLIVCTYFSHLFVFIILMMSLAVYEISAMFASGRSGFPLRFRKSLLLLVICIPCILLCLSYVKAHEYPSKIFLSKNELISLLSKMNPLIAYSETSELKDARSILYLMLFLFSASVILRALHFFRFRTGNGRAFRNKIKLGDGWLLISAVLLILLFLLPDSDFHAGFMSIRLCFLFYLSLLVWIGHQEYPKLLIIPVVFLSLVVLKSQFKVKFGCLSELNSIAIECHETSKLIKANTVIMPLNYTENWMLTHFSNYLGHEKPMVILDNYEACTGYFPLLFIPAAADRLLSYGESRNCISCPWDLALLPDRVDYIFALGKGDHLKQRCSPETDQKIAAFYTLIYKGDWVNLYALKRAAILSYTSPEANLLRMQLSKFNFLNLTTVNP